jgi:broad specificity phosphatase PhoE
LGDEERRVTNTGQQEADPEPGPAFALPGPLPDGVQVWLVRHGETEWSKSGQHTSRTELPLTAHGEDQARALIPMLDRLSPALVLSSPRQRALRTCELIGLRVDAVDPNLAEWDYGRYEGLTTHEIREQVPGWSLWTDPVPDGETAEQVGARADRVLRRAAEHLSEGPVILVGHGHMSRVLGARWIGLRAVDGGRLALDTAAPSVLSAQYGESLIEHWNLPNPARNVA